MQGFVYHLTGTSKELQRLAQTHLGEAVWHWVADTARLTVGKAYPADWKEQGAVFNTQGELRWRVSDDDQYEALLLTTKALPNHEALPGEWTVEEQALYLQDLREARVLPQFAQYPTGKPAGKIRVRLYCREGVPTFVSLCEFLEEEA
nr:hypothetical protein [Ardenticatena sp.]